MTEQDVSVVIPLYNEEKTVANVIQALSKLAFSFELIFVNDGSTDSSQEILERFSSRIKIIKLKKNRGKGFAMALGVKKAKGRIIVFLDADLINLKPEHVERLVLPLLIKQAEAAIASISSTSGLFDPLTKFSGQRAYFRKDLLPYLKEMSKTGYGAEVFLNKILKNKKTKKVKLKEISYLPKKKKMDSAKLPPIYLKEALEISRTIVQINGMTSKEARLVFSDRKIKSFKDLLKAIAQAENVDDLKSVKEYLSRYFKMKVKNE